MCGICGVFDRAGRSVTEPLLRDMMAAVRHRGPDGDGAFFDQEIGLGHRRLSIIDLEGGAQPIDNENGSLHVVFNGEIYNFVELRRELESFGHRFKTRSDTEVIVHAYEQWGTDFIRRLNGMFAFALWDSSRRELILARDHLGIKPLYYVDIGTRLLFASEIKSLLKDPLCPRQVDARSLAQLFTFRFVPSPRTMFEGIRKLNPGHWMKVTSQRTVIERFWNWVPRAHTKTHEGLLIEEYQGLLEDAVKLQLRSDVPLGLFLSSGIDSGSLLAIMSQYSPGAVRAFSIGFEGGEGTNEVDDAKTMASMFGARHESMIVTPSDYLQYYERYLWDIEEPVGNESAAAFYFVSRIASRHVKVALTGQGADEPWAGYGRHLGAQLSTVYSRVPTVITQSAAHLIALMPGRLERLKRSAIALRERDILSRFVKMYSFFSAEMKRQLFTADFRQRLSTDEVSYPTEALRPLQADVKDMDPLTQMLYIDTRSNLPDDLLMVGDKTSMANSLEARVPFLDYRLVEFVERLPPCLKLNMLRGKYLHKRALAKWLPKDIIRRKKKGFANPVEHWLRDGMRPFVEECLLTTGSAVSEFFDQKYIAEILRLDREGRQQYRRHIYLLLSFALWQRAFIR